MKIKENIMRSYRSYLRKNLNETNQINLQNKDFTIFSSNCVGGIIYHELHLEFLTPTINLFIKPCDFIKFVKNPFHYKDVKKMVLVEDSDLSYPLVAFEDIHLFCVHYKSLDEIKLKWNERFGRINWNNIFIIMSERDGCEYEDILAFDQLPYDNKVVFVHKDMKDIKSSLYIPGTEIEGPKDNRIIPLTSYKGIFTGKRYIDDFDYVKFLNAGKIQLK